jgi:hypothetical protein
MNLEKLLAENMLRFGVKNLSDTDLYRISQTKLLKEEISSIQQLPGIDLALLLVDQDFANAVSVSKTWISQNTVLFNTPNADIWLTMCVLNSYNTGYSDKILKNMTPGKEQRLLKLYNALYNNEGYKNQMADTVNDVLNKERTRTTIQLNEHPDTSGMVLTNGTITANQFTRGDVNGASKITDIVTFMNDHNLTNSLVNLMGDNCIELYRYKIIPKISAPGYQRKKALDGNDSFISGDVGKPGVGALSIVDAAFYNNSRPVFYSTLKFNAAAAVTTGKQITTVTFTAGEELTADLGKQLFKTGTIEPGSDMAAKVKDAVDGAKKIGTITAVRVESGASFDRPVNADNATFAKMVGMPTNKVPADPKIDKEGTVTDPMSGGNAFLAHYRGIAIQDALGNQAGVTPTMVAKVANGGDQAQYARILFTVKKPDNTNTITDDDVNSISKGSVSSDLSGIFRVVKYELM